MKVALVYDRVNKWGGAERVLLALHKIFPKAPLYTSVYDKKGAPWAGVFPKIYTSFLQNLPFARQNHEFFAVLMPWVFESFDFSDYDLVISVTSEAAKGIKTRGRTKHICYCLTPTRYLWSHYEHYFGDKVLRFVSAPFVKYLKSWDKKAAERPDIMVAISRTVSERIKRYYGRSSVIITPPASFVVRKMKKEKGKFFLLVSRLDFGYKKVDLAIKAFNKLDFPLVIIGS